MRHVLLTATLLLIGIATHVARVHAFAANDDTADVRKAVGAFFTAMGDGDLATLSQLSIGTTPQVDQLNATATMYGAQKRLTNALRSRFGEAGVAIVPIKVNRADDNARTGEVDVTGETATLTLTGSEKQQALRLQKIDGAWKMELASLIHPTAIGSAKKLQAVGEAMDSTSAEIAAGKYAKLEDVSEILSERVHAAMSGEAATSRP